MSLATLAGRRSAPPDPDELDVRAVMLATEGRAFSEEAIELAARIARRCDAPVHVFVIARIWGTGLGFPNPGLFPSKREWSERREVADAAVSRLEKREVDADARVIGTRAGAKRIAKAAEALDCDAIVMDADRPRNRFLADFMWSQEPYRVRRRARAPVYLVLDS